MRGDINLLPIKRVGESTKQVRGFIILFLLFIGAVTVFLVYLPNKDKINLKKEIEMKERELTTYTTSQEEYDELLKQVSLLKDRINAFDHINNNNLLKSKVLEDIEKAIPKDIILKDLSYSGNEISIVGSAKEELLVSQFMVKAKEIEDVANVTLLSINYKEEDESYTFSLIINFTKEFFEDTKLESKEENGKEAAKEEGDNEEVANE